MLEEQIKKDYIQAMKDKDKVRSATLNFLRAQLKNVIIEKKADHLEDVDVIVVLKKQVKQRQDSLEQFKQGGREDLVQKETEELVVLKEYLPEELSEAAIEKIVDEVIAETGASSIKDMGQVMKAAGVKLAGRADNRFVSQIVKAKLST